QQYRNLRIQEVDWLLNEAAELFVKMIAEPRLRNHLGFETSQRSIDDIRTLVVNDRIVTVVSTSIPSSGPVIIINTADIPNDYMFFLSGYALISKGNCDKKVKIT